MDAPVSPDAAGAAPRRRTLPLRALPLRALVGLALAALVVSLAGFQVHDYDIGLHIGKGRFQVEHGRIPVPSDLLCSGLDTPVSHAEKWAFQVLAYALDHAGGPAALVAFRLAMVALLWGLVFVHAARRTGGAWLPAGAVVALAVLVAEERFADRPELVTFPMAAAFALLLEAESRRDPRRGGVEGRGWSGGPGGGPGGGWEGRVLWVLPLLQAAWVNFHPVFVLGPALCVLYLVGAAASAWACARREGAARLAGTRGAAADGVDPKRPAAEGARPLTRGGLMGRPAGPACDGGAAAAATATATAVLRFRRLLLVTGLVAVACLANPDFLRGALFPLRFASYLGDHARAYAEHVTELRSPFLHEPFPTHAVFFFEGWLALAAVLLPAWFVLGSLLPRRVRRRPSPVDLLLLGVCVFAAASVRRNIALCAILTAPLLAEALASVFAGLAALPALRRALRPARRGGASLAAAALLFTTCLGIAASVLSGQWYVVERHHRRVGFGLNPDHLPVRAVEWMRAQGLRGNVFASWDVGSYLLWKDFPVLVPWISTEGDHSLELLRRYQDVMSLQVPFDAVAGEALLESVVLRHTALDTRPLLGALARSREWGLVYADDVAVIFVKRDGPYAALALARAAEPFVPPAWNGPAAAPASLLRRLWSCWRAFPEAAAHFRMACAYGLFARASDERRELDRALAIFPEYPEALARRGVGHALEDRADAAEADFRAALAAKPDHVSTLRNLASLLSRQGRVGEALALLERAYEANPDDPGTSLDLGAALMREGRYGEAASALEALVAREPGNLPAHQVLARLYQDLLVDPARARDHQRAVTALQGNGEKRQ